ncbi:hypothetical protein [Microtetraspora malaysiensis]|uniref:hypothetical protein n=1 Tax=Microtetraspora malaysiensis TaxID=161358 RepID=UPI003D915702
MVGSLHDNHSHPAHRAQPPGGPGEAYGLGFTTSPGYSITYRARVSGGFGVVFRVRAARCATAYNLTRAAGHLASTFHA